MPPQGARGQIFFTHFFLLFFSFQEPMQKFEQLEIHLFTSDMTSEGLGEMFKGDSGDTCAGKFPLVSMGGRVEGLACADLETRTPIGTSGNFVMLYF